MRVIHLRRSLFLGLLMTEELATASAFYLIARSVGRTMSTSSSSSPSSSSETQVEVKELPRQWVVLRKDLASMWPMGSVVAQACHASVAALFATMDDPLTAEYTKEGIVHHLWIEQPEGIPTCLATKPYFKQDAPSALKRYG
ncbi:hypothetical protein CTAYLR_001252 [Chrysophaeum taylorii]|uniref:peptidyl-tRNA hydrolase n=1 Tax=Chrysophaeum taylorii TaxID=2483200 RepID=A0AAD7UCK5_9STRA|nr:hypothetical protein CTAYLR_001252 [Chrysophaeum taylorii]